MSKSTTPRLLFRADGNATIGLGHLIRTLALADRLRGLAPGSFLVRAPTQAVIALITAEHWSLEPLPANQTPPDEADWLAQHVLRPGDVLVIDGYEFDFDYQLRVQASGCWLVVIDDLHAWPVLADVLINHSPGISADNYQYFARSKLLLGPAHALLRAPFIEAAAAPLTGPVPPITNALVCFGGADPLRLTERTLVALQHLPQLRHLGLVVGSAFEYLSALQAAVANASRTVDTSIYQNCTATELVELFRTSDVIIAPASTVLIELLVLGRPVITGYYAANQQQLAEYTSAHGQTFSAGNFAALDTQALHESFEQGIRFHETTSRHPYVTQLHPKAVRDAVQQLLIT